VHGHGDTECETHEKRAKGLQAVEPFRHERFPEFRIIVELRSFVAI
jgi:hypothetical protein